MTATSLWLGNDSREGLAGYGRARAVKMSELRARVVGCVTSFKDCWAPQSSIAEFLHCSVRTVQRGLHDARESGLIGCAFGKPREKPPGAAGPLHFKFSHRWTIGRGLVGDALHEAINKARLVCVITKAAIRRTFNAPVSRPAPKRQVTAAELDDALAAPERDAMRDKYPARGERAPKRVTAAELDAILNAHEPEPPDR